MNYLGATACTTLRLHAHTHHMIIIILYILSTLSCDALGTTNMSTTSMLLPFPVLVIIIITTAVVFLSTPRFTYAENQNEYEREEDLDFIQRFVHPYVTEGSTLDSAPFSPPHHTPAGFPGVRVLCKCGIQNGKSAHWTITKNEEELELDVNETIWSGSSSNADSNERSQNVTISDSLPFLIPVHKLISKGIEAEINEYPWIVALIYNLSNGTQVHFCGGTLFSNKYILTATHCLAGRRADKTEVWLNEHDILLSTETPGGTLQIKAQKFIIHPKYNSIMHYNDISIIELEEEVDIKQSYYRPLCLPPPNFDPITSESGVEGVAAGWGQTFFHGPKSAKLLKVSLPILSHEGCIAKSEPFYKKRVTDHMICAGDTATGGRDTCPGDSGGPLFVSHRGKNILVGIVSWGYRCGEPKKPGVYTRVSKYINWINQETSHGQRCAG